MGDQYKQREEQFNKALAMMREREGLLEQKVCFLQIFLLRVSLSLCEFVTLCSQFSLDNKQRALPYSLIFAILLVRLFLGECSDGRKPVFA